jgi:DNA-binding NarL/FixJ family response regulator
MMTALSEGEHILKAIRNGSSGYFQIHDDWDRLILGIRAVHWGGSLMSPAVAAKAFCPPPPKAGQEFISIRNMLNFQRDKMNFPGSISRQDLRLIAYIAQGLPDKEIAQIFNLKAGTVRNYISSILQKTGLRNRTEVALLAYTLGLNGD